MPFPFVYVCDLLDKLAELVERDVPLIPKTEKHEINKRTLDWFMRHCRTLNEWSIDDQAVLMMFTPEQQSDRAYGLSEGGLEQLIARVLNLPSNLLADLQMWQTSPHQGDLGLCVERVMENLSSTVATRAVTNNVAVEEIDRALLIIASHNSNSSPAVQSLSSAGKSYDAIELLGNLYRRLQAREAKWLTRIILKSHGRIKFPQSLVFNAHTAILPRCLQVRADFSSSEQVPILLEGRSIVRGNGAPESPVSPVLPAIVAPSRRSPDSPTSRPPQTPGIQLKAFVPPASSALTPTTISQSGGPWTCEPAPSANPGHLIITSQPPLPNDTEPKLSIPMDVIGTGKCKLTQQRCPLASCIFLLAPCIASTPYITCNLLTWHGSHFITSPRAFADPSLPRRCPETAKPFRKIALIESNKPKQTVEFLKRIGKLGLKRRGKKEWVEVYDWRILESIAKVDRGKDLGYNPWRRCWIGAV